MLSKKKLNGNGASAPFITIQCEGTMQVALRDLVPLQGDLKSLSKTDFNKATKSLVKYGFTFPFFVWRNGGKLYVLDGHQRVRDAAVVRISV